MREVVEAMFEGFSESKKQSGFEWARVGIGAFRIQLHKAVKESRM